MDWFGDQLRLGLRVLVDAERDKLPIGVNVNWKTVNGSELFCDVVATFDQSWDEGSSVERERSADAPVRGDRGTLEPHRILPAQCNGTGSNRYGLRSEPATADKVFAALVGGNSRRLNMHASALAAHPPVAKVVGFDT